MKRLDKKELKTVIKFEPRVIVEVSPNSSDLVGALSPRYFSDDGIPVPFLRRAREIIEVTSEMLRDPLATHRVRKYAKKAIGLRTMEFGDSWEDRAFFVRVHVPSISEREGRIEVKVKRNRVVIENDRAVLTASADGLGIKAWRSGRNVAGEPRRMYRQLRKALEIIPDV